jgi:hypothetical protein
MKSDRLLSSESGPSLKELGYDVSRMVWIILQAQAQAKAVVPRSDLAAELDRAYRRCTQDTHTTNPRVPRTVLAPISTKIDGLHENEVDDAPETIAEEIRCNAEKGVMLS